jgi:hypothetical protein
MQLAAAAAPAEALTASEWEASYNRNLWMRHLNEGATYLPL